MKNEADNSETWMGSADRDCMKRARQFIDKLEFLTDLCVHKPNRVVDFEEKKKKKEDEEEEED